MGGFRGCWPPIIIYNQNKQPNICIGELLVVHLPRVLRQMVIPIQFLLQLVT